MLLNSNRTKPFWISTLPCEIAAYIAIHTFGIRMIYPGSIRLLQSFLHPVLVQGRAKLVEEEHAKRYKLKTVDGNDIDTIFIDHRADATEKDNNGKTLVICSEGNAGFYEIGIMTTPIALKYSVLGWNHPGFGGSTVKHTHIESPIELLLNVSTHYYIGLTISTTRSTCNRCCYAVCHTDARLSARKHSAIRLEHWRLFVIGGCNSISRSQRSGMDIMYIRPKEAIFNNNFLLLKVLDATFDDVLQLAIPRMPSSISGIVRIAIRDYVNLNNTELINQYSGPVMLVRRTKDEIIAE